MTDRSTAPDFAAILREHAATHGPITGSWTCACGVGSINGKASLGTLTSREQRAEQYAAHVAAVLQAAAREAVFGLMDEYNQHDDEDGIWECEPEDRWRFGRDLRALLAPDRGSEAQG